tara:strand:+ start:713 stop:2533 length:1821 start_codon:yes stop_codon:yes gene_type:complete
MALKDLLTDLGSFYKDNPFAAKYKSKAGPTYAQKYGFNQRSLKYGNDRPADASSKQPFIITPLPDVNSDPTAGTGLAGGISRQIVNRVEDLARITKFLLTPKGLLFIGKQELLATQNPIVPGRPNRSGQLKGFYNPLSTLVQVAASGTGLHLEKQGLLPIGLQDNQVKYETVYTDLDKDKEGRLYNLYKYKIAKDIIQPSSKAVLEKTGISTDSLNLIEYNGGPGVLKTIIRATNHGVYNGSGLGDSIYTWNQKDFNNVIPASQNGYKKTILPDFRSNIAATTANRTTGIFGENAVDYSSAKVNKITRVGLGDPGRRARNRSNLYRGDFESVDKVAAMPLYKGSIAAEEGYTRDFIRFRFEVLDNDTNTSTNIHFRAFLGAITDNYGGSWGSTKYVGRGDSFYNYEGFTRSISLSFKVHPQTRDEMAAMYQKLTYLASTLAPDYSSNGGYMRGNIVKLVVGSYLYRIPGFITSLTYSVPEDGSWEIAYNEPEKGTESDQLETPRHFDVQLSFTPIHDFAPQLMDGTRKYALFTPDQANQLQPNPYLPKEGENSIIYADAELAEEVVKSIPSSQLLETTGNESNTLNSGNAFGDNNFGIVDNQTQGL